MATFKSLFFLYLPWLILIGVCGIFIVLSRWAKQKKASALLFGAVLQMFLPDPQIEKTITIVQESKQAQKKCEDSNDEPVKNSAEHS